MRANLKSFLDLGDNHSVIYLGGNGIYERVCYDQGGDLMRVTGDANAKSGDPRPNRFQDTDKVLCVKYSGGFNPSSAFIVTDQGAAHPFLRGVTPTISKLGPIIGRLGLNGSANGWEVDRRKDGNPGILLAYGAPVDDQSTMGGHMTYMKLKSDSNFVFSAGSLTFGGSLVVDRNLQMIVKNALTAAGVTS